jgi:DNA-binding NarL/FixJ family response regulator
MTNDICKVAIAEPSALIRKGLIVFLKQLSRIKIQVVEIASIDDLSLILKTYSIDLLFINPSYWGFEIGKKIRNGSQNIDIKIIALVYHPFDNGLLAQYDDVFSIFDTTNKLDKMVDTLLRKEVQSSTKRLPLSTREQEIIVCIVKGMTNKEIADKLFLSSNTIITHRRNITKKLQIHSSAGLTIYAIVNKLVRLEDIQTSIEPDEEAQL